MCKHSIFFVYDRSFTNMKLSLSKKECLKSRKTIERLFKEGKDIYAHPLKLIYLPIDELAENDFPIKFGVSVAKRKFKTAVARNLLKRRMREAYRINKLALYKPLKDDELSFAWMFLYMSKKEESFEQIEQGFLKIRDKFLATLASESK